VVNDGNELNELCKFADDIVPAHNVDPRIREVTNVEECARANSLTLNHQKPKKLCFETVGVVAGLNPIANGRHCPCHCSEDSWRHYY